MWDEMLNKIYNFISSLKLSIFLTVSCALYYVFLSIWSLKSPPIVIQNISKMLPFKLVYIFLLINTFFCLTKRVPELLKSISKNPIYLPGNYDWVKEIKREGIKEGFKIKRRFSSLGTLIFHISFFLLALGFYLSSQSHTTGKFLVGEGEELIVDNEEIKKTSTSKPLFNEFPEFKIKIDKIQYKFWGEKLLFSELEARGKIDEKDFSVKINKIYPLNLSNFIRITSFGYAPSYLLLIENYPKPLEEGVIKIFLFPPGTKSFFKTKHFPHKIYLSLYPDFYEENGIYKSKSMEPKNPKMLIQVYRNKVFLMEKLINLGDLIKIEEFSMVFLNLFPLIEVEIVQDKGILIIFLSFILILIASILRFSGKRGEILIRKEGDLYKIYGKNVKEF